jgi:hypothetical protein
MAGMEDAQTIEKLQKAHQNLLPGWKRTSPMASPS